MTEKQFIKYDGNKIIDLKYDKSWRISIGDVDLLLKILNNENNENDITEPKILYEAIELILDGIVEMHDGKRDYAETIFNKAIKLLKGDME